MSRRSDAANTIGARIIDRATTSVAKSACGRDRAPDEGRRLYAQRRGVEATLSQGVRAFDLRRARYRGLAKTSLQHIATAAAINLDRIAAWFAGRPLAPTRTSRFAMLAA